MIGEDRVQLALFVVERCSFSRSIVDRCATLFVVDCRAEFSFTIRTGGHPGAQNLVSARRE